MSSLSPSKHVREPNLPIRKKVPEYDNRNNSGGDDFIILGDQSHFSLNMIPYRARSLSAHKYSDSPDMLRWIGDDDDHQDTTGIHHKNTSNNVVTNDSHFHAFGDESTNQNVTFSPQQQLSDHDSNNNNLQAINNNNDANDKMIKKKPGLTSIRKIQQRSTHQKQNSLAPKLKQSSIKPRRNTTPAKQSNNNNKSTFSNGNRDFAKNETTKKSTKEFQSKSDVGKFLNERREEMARKVKPNPTGFPGGGNKTDKGIRIDKKSTNSDESLGKAIASKSLQNKENMNNNEAPENVTDGYGGPQSRPRHRSLSEYQDKFQWNVADYMHPLSSSYNLHKSQPGLTSFTTDPHNSYSEYADQFRPKSALPFQDHHHHPPPRHHHHHHHNPVHRDDGLHENLNGNSQLLSPGDIDVSPANAFERDNVNNDTWNRNGFDEQGMHLKNLRHYQSEYTKKFIPPSDYLLVDNAWVKADHVRRILADRNVAPRHEVITNDGSLRVLDFAGQSVPSNFGNDLKSPIHVTNPNDGMSVSNIASSANHVENLGDTWFDYILQLRRRANAYRIRGFGTNFSRDHLAQLPSKYLRYWDESSEDGSISPGEEELLTRSYHLGVQGGQNFGYDEDTTPHPITNSNINTIPRSIYNNPLTKRGHWHHDHVNHSSNNTQNWTKPSGRRGRPIGHDPLIGGRNPEERGSDELSESLSSSLSLAEEVLERAKQRKDQAWATK